MSTIKQLIRRPWRRPGLRAHIHPVRCMIAATAAAVGLSVGAAPAMAGTAGQQIYFTTYGQSCGPLYGPITISGYNQNGQHSVWTGHAANGASVSVAGYWWKGWVKIAFGNRAVFAQVPAVHDVTDGQWPDWVFVTCQGTRYYPTYYRFNNLGGKVYLLLNNNLAWDPLFGKYLDRNTVFGYWDGHFVYKVTDSIGIDINTGQMVVAETTNHWIILGGAVAGARFCNQVSSAGYPVQVRAAVTAWCAAAGAITTYAG